jgi:hypothetical protein
VGVPPAPRDGLPRHQNSSCMDLIRASMKRGTPPLRQRDGRVKPGHDGGFHSRSRHRGGRGFSAIDSAPAAPTDRTGPSPEHGGVRRQRAPALPLRASAPLRSETGRSGRALLRGHCEARSDEATVPRLSPGSARRARNRPSPPPQRRADGARPAPRVKNPDRDVGILYAPIAIPEARAGRDFPYIPRASRHAGHRPEEGRRRSPAESVGKSYDSTGRVLADFGIFFLTD